MSKISYLKYDILESQFLNSKLSQNGHILYKKKFDV